MRYAMPLFVFVSSLVFGSYAFAAKESFKTVKSSEVAAWLKDPAIASQVAVYDANGEKVRKSDGVVPGAKMLSSSDEYDVAKELPANKDTKLVFYCANERCTASHDAADRATKAGFANVYVMSDGIKGWNAMGKTAKK